MTYRLKFHPKALNEFESLSQSDRDFFKKKLKERLENPHIPASRLKGAQNLYKIKRKTPPLRLAYHVDDKDLIVTTLSVGKRDGSVYVDMLLRHTSS